MKLIFSKQQPKPPLKSRATLLKAIRRALKISGLAKTDPNGEVHVVILGQDAMQALNLQHLGKANPTDVLAFDLRGTPVADDEPAIIAEIYVCLEVAVRASREYNTSVGHEVVLYIVHGMLHLLGEDDHDPVERQHMRNAEKRIMDELQTELSLNKIF